MPYLTESNVCINIIVIMGTKADVVLKMLIVILSALDGK